MKKTTMQDIADELSISLNAVSIALNDKQGVSNDLRIKILETATQLNYPLKKLNAKATLKNKTLAVLIEERKRNDRYYYLDLLHHIQKEAKIFGFRILIEYYDFTSFEVPKCISEHHVAGVIILGKISSPMITSLKLYIKEILCINHSIPYINIDSMITNDFLGGYLACEFLIQQGCQSIGFIGEISRSSNFKQRYLGYHKCMMNYFHLKYTDFICLTQDIEDAVIHDNYQYIQKLLLTYREMPEAFICVNDRNAAIVIKALQYNGYKVPNDIKVIGFDNMEFAHYMTPSLSTLEVSRHMIAKRAVRRIHEMIHENTIPESIMLSPRIIERNSTK